MFEIFETPSVEIQRVIAVKEFGLRSRNPHIPPPTLDFLDTESSSDEEEAYEDPKKEVKPKKQLNSFKIRKTSETTSAPISAILIPLQKAPSSVLYKEHKRKHESISPDTTDSRKISQEIVMKKIEADPVVLLVAAPKSEEKKIEVIAMENQVVQKAVPQPLALSVEACEKIRKALETRNFIKQIFKEDKHLSFEELRHRHFWASDTWDYNYSKRIEIIQGWVDEGLLEYAMISNMTKYSVGF
jgi:hypothetical protein